MHASRREFISGAAAATVTAGASAAAQSPLAIIKSPAAGLNGLCVNVADVTSLAALRTDSGATMALLVGDPGAGLFRLIKYRDNSALIDADTERQGAFVRSTYDSTMAWRRLGIEAGLNIMHFGAMGVGDERLHPANYLTDDIGTPVKITRQTNDGLAINAALRLLRLMGGGRLVFPAGEFTTYGYLERIDFPLDICGAGRGITIIRNSTSSPWENGYGVFYVRPETPAKICICELTVDGRGAERTTEGGEVRAYGIIARGLPNLMLDNVETRNSPIDTFATKYTNGNVGTKVTATNCLFSGAFRNTVSLVSGWNQHYSNCIFENGGKIQGGTAPKAVLDIEPDASTATIKDIIFENCVFRGAVSSIISGVWADNVCFNHCRIEVKGGTGATGSLGAVLPYAFYVRAGQFSFRYCIFEETDGNFKASAIHAAAVKTDEPSFLELSDCRFYGCGFQALGNKTEIHNCSARNCLFPFYFGGTAAQNLIIDGLRLLNVFDLGVGTGMLSSFGITAAFKGSANVTNLDVRVNTADIASRMIGRLVSISQAFGVNLASDAKGKIDMSNIYAAGFYQQLPRFLGKRASTANFRDWRTPPAPPGDTPAQTTNETAYIFRNCTQYGNRP